MPIDFINKAKAAASNLVDHPMDAINKAIVVTEQVMDMGKEKFKEMSEKVILEMEGLKPILTQCGFVVGDINLTFPLPLELKMTVDQTREGKTTLEAILAEDCNLTTLQRAVLSSMVKANELAQITDRFGYTFKQYDITLTTPPKVTVHLISKKLYMDDKTNSALVKRNEE